MDEPAAKRRKGKQAEVPETILFKAYTSSPYQLLSNLFGNVEAQFQRVKFRQGSGVREFLDYLAEEELSEERFCHLFEELDAGGKAESYILTAFDNPTHRMHAVGILAKATSIVAYSDSQLALMRLHKIRLWHAARQGAEKPKRVSKATYRDWQKEYVTTELKWPEKEKLLTDLLFWKFRKEPYKTLLLSTGSATLGERDDRGGRSTPYTISGGNLVGRILMKHRAKLQAA